MIGEALAKRGVAVVDYLGTGGTVSAAAPECGVTSAATEEADQRGGEHDQRERHVENENRDERQRGKTAHDVVLQGTRADPHHCLQHDCPHRRLQSEEQALDRKSTRLNSSHKCASSMPSYA